MYMACNLKTIKLLDCALIGVCAVIGSNTVCLKTICVQVLLNFKDPLSLGNAITKSGNRPNNQHHKMTSPGIKLRNLITCLVKYWQNLR